MPHEFDEENIKVTMFPFDSVDVTKPSVTTPTVTWYDYAHTFDEDLVVSGSLTVSNGLVVSDNITNTSSLKSHTLVIIADPQTGGLASKTSGWTADSFSGGLSVDCTASVPTDAIMVLIPVNMTATRSNVYVRGNNDPGISNTPVASSEISCRIMQAGDDQFNGLVRVIGGIFQIAVSSVDTDITVGYPRAYLI